MSRTRHTCIVIRRLRKYVIQYIMRGQLSKNKGNKQKTFIFVNELFDIF